jgi:hypothetical protein
MSFSNQVKPTLNTVNSQFSTVQIDSKRHKCHDLLATIATGRRQPTATIATGRQRGNSPTRKPITPIVSTQQCEVGVSCFA